MSCWELLGISQSADARAIKRAYAACLKKTRPDDDPQAFQDLRAAYEQALAEASCPAEMAVLPDAADSETDPDYAEFEAWLRSLEEDIEDAPPEAASGGIADEPGTSVNGSAALWAALPANDVATDLRAAFDGFFRNLEADDTPARLSSLLGDRRWQRPEWMDVLEAALLAEIDRELAAGSAGSLSQALYTRGLWRPLVEQAARHFGWLEHLPRRLAAHAGVVSWLRRELAQQQADAVIGVARRDGLLAAEKELREVLGKPDWVHLDNRHALMCAWVGCMEQGGLPAGVQRMVCRVLGWQDDPAALESLPGGIDLLRWLQQNEERDLLELIAAEEIRHATISREIAERLLRPEISWRDWRDAAVKKTPPPDLQTAMREILTSLAFDAPLALERVAPAVRAWWQQPRPLERDWWMVLGVIGWVGGMLLGLGLAEDWGLRGSWWVAAVALPAGVVGGYTGYALAWLLAATVMAIPAGIRRFEHWLEGHSIRLRVRWWLAGWLLAMILLNRFGLTFRSIPLGEPLSRLPGWPADALIGALLGGLLGWALEWLHQRWRRVYAHWCAVDRSLANRLAGPGRWLSIRDIGLTRDLLPFLGLFLSVPVQLAMENEPLPWLLVLIWLVISFALSRGWSKVLRWISRS